jgi:hypothetical protein
MIRQPCQAVGSNLGCRRPDEPSCLRCPTNFSSLSDPITRSKQNTEPLDWWTTRTISEGHRAAKGSVSVRCQPRALRIEPDEGRRGERAQENEYGDSSATRLRDGVGVDQVVGLQTRSDLRRDNLYDRDFPFGRPPWPHTHYLNGALDARTQHYRDDDER